MISALCSKRFNFEIRLNHKSGINEMPARSAVGQLPFFFSRFLASNGLIGIQISKMMGTANDCIR